MCNVLFSKQAVQIHISVNRRYKNSTTRNKTSFLELPQDGSSKRRPIVNNRYWCNNGPRVITTKYLIRLVYLLLIERNRPLNTEYQNTSYNLEGKQMLPNPYVPDVIICLPNCITTFYQLLGLYGTKWGIEGRMGIENWEESVRNQSWCA
jgi:hypothetical protein